MLVIGEETLNVFFSSLSAKTKEITRDLSASLSAPVASLIELPTKLPSLSLSCYTGLLGIFDNAKTSCISGSLQLFFSPKTCFPQLYHLISLRILFKNYLTLYTCVKLQSFTTK